MNDNIVLSVRDLEVNFYNNERCNRVLRGVSFQLQKGKIMCIVGESGCGKTTTLKMINKLILPSDGTVEINGRDISHMDTIALRRRMGYVIQHRPVPPYDNQGEHRDYREDEE